MLYANKSNMVEDCGTTSQPSDEEPETPNSVEPRICSAVHHDLSVVKEFVHRSNLTAQRMLHKVVPAQRAGE